MSFDPMGYPQFDDCREIADGQKDAIIAAQKIHCEGQSAEIARLKTQVKELSDAYQKAIGPIKPADHKALITELCDALRDVLPYPLHTELVRRAREATR